MTLIDPGKQHPFLDPEDIPDVSHLVTEDDIPVDNLFSEKQQRFLVDMIYDGWEGAAANDFLASANVGVFPSLRHPPLVPDMYLSLDVVPPADPWPKSSRSYFVWEHGKPPDVVIEIVSNKVGEERGRKHREYARMGVPYYAILDPLRQISSDELQVLELDLNSRGYRQRDLWLPRVSLGLTLWEGLFQGLSSRWLRWCRQDGSLLLVGSESARQESKRADAEAKRADQAAERAQRLAEKLRALGVDPED